MIDHLEITWCRDQALLIRIKLQGGGGCPGGWVFSRVGGSKALDPPPFIIPRVSWVGHLPQPLSWLTEALSGCVLLPLFTLSLRRHHAQISLWFNSVVNASWTPIVRHVEGAMKDLIPHPQVFMTHNPAPPLRAQMGLHVVVYLERFEH